MEFTRGEVARCYRFAQEMVGNHNPDMIMGRDDWEIFRDDLRGKLGEVALKKYIQTNLPGAVFDGEIDYGVTPRGQWDITDLIVNDTYINVKAIRGRSRFLLIETKRYNDDGSYAYHNNDGEDVRVDMYALVRVNIEPEMSYDDMNYTSIDEFRNSKGGRTITATILGGINHDDFWNNKHFAPRGMFCNVHNLENVCTNEEISMATQEELDDETLKTRILQQNNYILDSQNELTSVIDLLLGGVD